METVDKKLVKEAIVAIDESFEEYKSEAYKVIERLKSDYKRLFEKYVSDVLHKDIKYNNHDDEAGLGYLSECYYNCYSWWMEKLGLDDEGEDDEN